jgi:hypothetical protein
MRTFKNSRRWIAAMLVGVSCSLSAAAADAANKEVIRFRHPRSATVHLKDEKSARTYEQSLKNLGCDAALSGHAGHFDLSYQCSQWREANFESHDKAHQWETFLKKLGFETQHQH